MKLKFLPILMCATLLQACSQKEIDLDNYSTDERTLPYPCSPTHGTPGGIACQEAFHKKIYGEYPKTKESIDFKKAVKKELKEDDKINN